MIQQTTKRSRALTTSEAAVKLIEMGFGNFRCTRIPDNEITLPFGETTKDVYYSVEVSECGNGRSYVAIIRFIKKYYEGRDLGATGKAIFWYAKAGAKQKKRFMELMEKVTEA